MERGKSDHWDDYSHRFKSVEPSTDDVADAHERARYIIADAAEKLCDLLPADLGLVLSRLEEALMWANKAIALGQNEHLPVVELRAEPREQAVFKTKCPHCENAAYFYGYSRDELHICEFCERPYVVKS